MNLVAAVAASLMFWPGRSVAGEDHAERGHNHRQKCANASVHLAAQHVFFLHALVHDGALLEEDHPGRNRGADIGHQEEEQFVRESSRRKLRDQATLKDLSMGGLIMKAAGM